jgi:hypothetical protein
MILAEGNEGMTVFSIDGEILHQYNLKSQFPQGTRIAALDWSPDGKKLAFNTRIIVFETYLMKNVLK